MSEYPGALIVLTDDGEGNYEAVQKEPKSVLGPPSGSISFSWGLGPISITGWVHPQTLDIGLNISVLGISLGNLISGNLKSGVTVSVNLVLAKGKLKFYAKNGKELWISVSLSVVFNGSYNGDYKIVSW